jgi:hypothetical protein
MHLVTVLFYIFCRSCLIVKQLRITLWILNTSIRTPAYNLFEEDGVRYSYETLML